MNQSATFNDGKTTIALCYSPANLAYFVWRQDGDYQALLRLHNELEFAQEDYAERCSFLSSITTK